MNTGIAPLDASVFQKFGGIRPMASKLRMPPSTIKSWHAKRAIPDWRHAAVLEGAARHGIDLSLEELTDIRPDAMVTVGEGGVADHVTDATPAPATASPGNADEVSGQVAA